MRKLGGFLTAVSLEIHAVTVTLYRSISVPAGFRRHLVGKTLRSVRYLTVI